MNRTSGEGRTYEGWLGKGALGLTGGNQGVRRGPEPEPRVLI